MGCVHVCAGVRECAQVCMGVCRYARVCAGMHGCAWVSASVHGCARVFAGVDRYSRVYAGVCTGVRWCVHGYAWVYACVWDEFSEFLLENRVPTSADFNTYPIRIFFPQFTREKIPQINFFQCRNLFSR